MTPAQIKQHQNKGAEIAKQLRVGMTVKAQILSDKIVVSKVVSEPWKLGHGTFVVSIEGVSGGVDCGRITILQ